jgi:hypothetical protein
MERKDVRRGLRWLNGRFKRYVYISTDSVYEVSRLHRIYPARTGSPDMALQVSALSNPVRPNGSLECDSVRPESADERELLRKK